MAKSIDEQIADLQAKKLEEEQKANFQEYPKHIRVGEKTFEARDAEHEKAIRGGKEAAEVVKVSEPPTEPVDTTKAPPKSEPATKAEQPKAKDEPKAHDKYSKRGQR